MLKVLVLTALALLTLAGAFDSAVAQDHRVVRVGGMEIIALADVPADPNAKAKPQLLIGMPEAQASSLPDGAMANSINMFVVKIGGDVVLFDTGLGEGGKGAMLASMASAGLKPEDITAVCITHFHPDHVGGLVRDGQATFPNARLMVPRIEVEDNPQAAMKFMPLYAGRLFTFEWEHEVARGVKAFAATGHTKGHTVFLLEEGGDKLLIIGDLIHFGGVQLANPDIAVTYDSEPNEAIRARKRIFDQAAAENLPVASMHLPFPGIGTLTKEGAGYSFTSVQ